jgi:hypothetical protein
MLHRFATVMFVAVFVLGLISGCTGGKEGGGGRDKKDAPGEKGKPGTETSERPAGKGAKLDPYLDALFAGPDDYELIHAVYKRIALKCDGSDAKKLAALPEAQRVVLHVCGTQGIVDKDGFHALFASKVADFRGMAAAFDSIGVPTASSAVRKALAIFPGSKPQTDAQSRVDYLAELGKTGEERLDDCSREFYDAHRSILIRTALYVRTNRDSFASLAPSPGEDLAELKKKNKTPPSADAYSRDVANWLESIDAEILVDAPAEKDRPFWVKDNLAGALRSGARIVGLSLSSYRTSTDKELQTAARMDALRDVDQVTLGDTYVTEAGLKCLKEFPNLHTLSLRRTDVSDGWLRQLQDLKLEELNLARTNVTDIGLEYVAKIRTLRFLELYRTQVSGSVAAILAKLPNLEVLSMGNTGIDDDSLEGIDALRRLRSLDLRYSRITDEAMRHVEKVVTLEELNQTGTRVGDLGAERLKKLANLKSLRLDETQISDAGLVPVGGIASLRELSLSFTDVGDAGAANLRSLRGLERLSLRKTSVGDAGLATLAQLRELAELDLRETRVTDAGLTKLFGLTKLSSILIDATDVTSAGVAQLRQALPRVEIQR